MTARGNPATYDVMVDIDDVVVPWFETVDAHCVERWGAHAGPCETWSMHEHYGVTRQEWEDIVIHATAQGLYTHVEPLPYAPEAVRRLRWYGHRVHIVTARGFMKNAENIREWTPEYLNRFSVPYDTLTFAKDKVAVQDELGVDFDFAIDDGLHNFTNLVEAGVPTWLQDAPHNRHFETDRRVQSLWEFSNIVLAGHPLASRKDRP